MASHMHSCTQVHHSALLPASHSIIVQRRLHTSVLWVIWSRWTSKMVTHILLACLNVKLLCHNFLATKVFPFLWFLDLESYVIPNFLLLVLRFLLAHLVEGDELALARVNRLPEVASVEFLWLLKSCQELLASLLVVLKTVWRASPQVQITR